MPSTSESTGVPQYVAEDLERRWSIHVLQSEWESAQKVAAQIEGLDDPRAPGLGAVLHARGLLFRGRGEEAQALADRAALQAAAPYLDPADAVGIAVDVRLEQGDAVGALRLLGEVRAAQGGRVEPRVAFWEPLVLARLGRAEETTGARRGLERDLASIPGPTGPRLLARLDGELALARGDAKGALRSFSEAARLLSARGFSGDHVPTWYALARAQIAAGRPADAEPWLEKITTASSERLCWPIAYARSFSLPGPRPCRGGTRRRGCRCVRAVPGPVGRRGHGRPRTRGSATVPRQEEPAVTVTSAPTSTLFPRGVLSGTRGSGDGPIREEEVGVPARLGDVEPPGVYVAPLHHLGRRDDDHP